VWTRKQIPMFQRNILPPSSALKMEVVYRFVCRYTSCVRKKKR
jgi:hypothetical protein